MRPRAKIDGVLVEQSILSPGVSGISENIPARGPYRASLRYAGGAVFGWVFDETAATPVWISVSVDDVHVWSGLARRNAEITVAGNPAPRPAGFRIALPPAPERTETRLITVTMADGSHIQGSPLLASHGDQYSGFVEKICWDGERVAVTGWCLDAAAPSLKVPLAVQTRIAGPVSEIAYNSRPDLLRAGINAPYAAFSLTIACGPGKPDLSDVAVFPGTAPSPLPAIDDAIVYAGPGDAQPEVTPPPVPTTGKDDIVEGTIDEITLACIRGWARNATQPDAPVVLDCVIDGIPYATTTAHRYRADLAAHFGDSGLHGYVFRLTMPLSQHYPGVISIQPRAGVNAINHERCQLQQALPASRIVAGRNQRTMLRYRYSPPLGRGEAADGITIVVVNRNGAAKLDSLFHAFTTFNSFANYEFLIIDQVSADGSRDVAARWGERIPVAFIPHAGPLSYAASANFGARIATRPLVLFVHTGIAFTDDTLGKIARYFLDPALGCLGVKLLDHAPVPRADGQTAIQHLGVHFAPSQDEAPVEPFVSRYSAVWQDASAISVEVPAVTAAFMACRTQEFLSIGGFDERYAGSIAGVDLCLRYQLRAKKVVVANEMGAVHPQDTNGIPADRQIFGERWGFWLRRRVTEQKFRASGYWSSTPVRIAFVVSEAGESALAGDYFTALELATQLAAQFHCECGFLETSLNREYDLESFDVVIAMIDDYDPRRIRNAAPSLIKIVWVRNWFDRFAASESAPLFDSIWASSQTACDFLSDRLSKPVHLLPLAGNYFRFQAGRTAPDLMSDYCFTGSYWGVNREIIQLLEPAALPFTCALYGSGWDQIASLAPYYRGPMPYQRMPDIYASTRLVIDDANHVTKGWGAVNSRVFDAILAGALVITNGREGANTLFAGLLPTFSTIQELEDLLWTYLGDEAARLEKVRQLRQFVLQNHTYQLRARTVWTKLCDLAGTQLRFSIKTGAPQEGARDHYYARGIKRALDALGHSARIDPPDCWNDPAAAGDDVVIMLRGSDPYVTKPHQINLMWNIGHPDKVSLEEYNSYDHVFMTSDIVVRALERRLRIPVTALPPCTDPSFFNADVPALSTPPRALFAGDFSASAHAVVKNALQAGLSLEIHGKRWEWFVADPVIRSNDIPNHLLASYYKSAEITLIDPEDDPQSAVSSQILDALACGARIALHDVHGLPRRFKGAVRTYADLEGLKDAVEAFGNETERDVQRRREIARMIVSEHSFAPRIQTILSVVRGLEARKLAHEDADRRLP